MSKDKGIIIGSIFMILGISIGAFGAHSLNETLGQNGTTETFKTGVDYLFYNAIGILIISITGKNNKYLQYSIFLLVAGILLFSFSLFILSITNIKWIGIITPFGGISFIIGWIYFILNQKKK